MRVANAICLFRFRLPAYPTGPLSSLKVHVQDERENLFPNGTTSVLLAKWHV